MKISIKVKPKSRLPGVTKVSGGFLVSVKAVAEGGKANEEAAQLLSDYFSVAKSSVKIVSGLTARNKIVEIGQR